MIVDIEEWYGPWGLVPGEAPVVYERTEAERSGLYLWLMTINDARYLYYIGVAGATTVAERQRQHVRCYLNGLYTLYEPECFSRGDKKIIYANRNERSLGEFLSKSEYYVGSFKKMAGYIHVHFAPAGNMERLHLERIESAVIRAVREEGGFAAGFLDNERVSRNWSAEDRVEIRTDDWPAFVGLPRILLC